MIRDLLAMLAVVLGFMLTTGLIAVPPIVGVAWYSACRQAAIYNAQHGSDWSCGDFFWAGDQINGSTSTLRLQ